MKKLLFILFALLLHNISYAQGANELVDIKEEVSVEAESSSAARDKAIQQVLTGLVEKFGVDLLGEKKYGQSKIKIHNTVLKDSGKFAPVQKAEVLTQGSPFKVAVSLKVSPQNLRELFEKTGIMTSRFESGQVMTFITVVDSTRARILKWWISDSNEDDFLVKINKALHSGLKKPMKTLNFQVVDPVEWKFKPSLTPQFQKDYFRKEDYASFEALYKIPLVIRGQVELTASTKITNAIRIQVKLSAVLTSQGKVVAETSRFLETEPGEISMVVLKNMDKIFAEASQDLADQLTNAFQKGVLESSMIQLALLGDLSYSNIENFRTTVLKNIGSIRYMSEKSIESDKRIYDVDYAGSAEELAKKIDALKFSGQRVKSSDISTKSLQIQMD